MSKIIKGSLLGFVFLLGLAGLCDSKAQLIQDRDTSEPKGPITSADTVLALPLDTAVTPWFHYPYWTSSADTFTNETGLIQQVIDRKSHLWMAGILIVALLIVGFVRTIFQRYFRSLFQAVLSMKQAKQLYEEQGAAMPFSAFLLNINFLLTVSLLIYLFLQDMNIAFPFQQFKGYALIVSISVVLYFFRYVSLKALYFLFPQLVEVDFYNFHFFLVNKIGGVVLIPFLFLVAFSSNMPASIAFYSSGGLLAILLIIHFGRGVLASKNYWQNDVLHFFIYICTLELAPSIVIIKSLNVLFT